MQQFPLTLQAVRAYNAATRQAESHLWAIGDALIAEAGPPSAPGVNNGSLDQINKVAKFLKAEGFQEFSVGYLQQVRSTASAFTAPTRVAAVPFSIYRQAGDPETLEAATEHAEQQGKALSVRFVLKFQRQRQKEEDERERRKNEKLRGRPEPDVARETALTSYRKAAAQAEGLADHAADLFAKHLSGKLTDLEQEDLISADTAVATRWENLAETKRSKSPLSEAAE